jgi:hypothetical protein
VLRKPKRVKLRGRNVPFTYANGVVRATVELQRGTLRLNG